MAETTEEPATAEPADTVPENTGAASSAEPADSSIAAERAPAGPRLVELLEREGEIAADYLEGLLDIVDADGDIDMDVDGDRAAVSIIGPRLRHLVGPAGNVLEALQELTRLAVLRETGARTRLMLDVGGFRARRRAELVQVATVAIDEVRASGQPVHLAAMSAFERKVVHDAVAAAGLHSESEGVEPQRHVVVLSASTGVGDDRAADSSAVGGAGEFAAESDAGASDVADAGAD